MNPSAVRIRTPIRALRQFLDISNVDRRGIAAMAGGFIGRDETYNDSSGWCTFPKLDVSKPGVIVGVLHGNGDALERDVETPIVCRNDLGFGGNDSVLGAQIAWNAADSAQ